jgi:hypothetical protein
MAGIAPFQSAVDEEFDIQREATGRETPDVDDVHVIHCRVESGAVSNVRLPTGLYRLYLGIDVDVDLLDESMHGSLCELDLSANLCDNSRLGFVSDAPVFVG